MSDYFGYGVLGFGAGGGVVPIPAPGGAPVAEYVGSDGFTYRYHQFTNTGNFVVVSLGSDETWGNKIDYLVQAGGAGGGNTPYNKLTTQQKIDILFGTG